MHGWFGRHVFLVPFSSMASRGGGRGNVVSNYILDSTREAEDIVRQILELFQESWGDNHHVMLCVGRLWLASRNRIMP